MLFSTAKRAMLADRSISSYDELVQLPINPTFTSSGYPFSSAAFPNSEIGHALSGVKGPLTWGSSLDKSISIISS